MAKSFHFVCVFIFQFGQQVLRRAPADNVEDRKRAGSKQGRGRKCEQEQQKDITDNDDDDI